MLKKKKKSGGGYGGRVNASSSWVKLRKTEAPRRRPSLLADRGMDSAAEDSGNADRAGDGDDLISGLHDDVCSSTSSSWWPTRRALAEVARALGARSRAPLRLLSPAGSVVLQYHGGRAVRRLGGVRLLRQRRPCPA